MKHILALPLLLLAVACGGGEKPPPDAGVDESCGIDCDAQKQFGLIVGKCFEYSKTSTAVTPPDLGVHVGEVVTLEGGVKAIPVTYRTGGLTKMEDSFTFKNGDLYLVRRTWQASESVTYKDDAGNIVGVLWLRKGTSAGETIESPGVKADFINGSNRSSDNTTFTVSTTAATANDLKTPQETFAEGLRLSLSETPLHGADTRRYFVRDTGFIRFSSYLQLQTAGASAQEYVLQKTRDIPVGQFDCGF